MSAPAIMTPLSVGGRVAVPYRRDRRPDDDADPRVPVGPTAAPFAE